MIFLKKTGRIRPKDAFAADGARFGIGLEKLDRSLYDPAPAYDKIAAIGARMVRIQSGWARTEKEEGVYDFAWLDGIVDALVSRGMEPWICLCYGNPVYTKGAADAFSAVGRPPVGEEKAMSAWLRYCRKTAERYRGKVGKYEIWNEPEWLWPGGSDPVSYGRFAAETAKALKDLDPSLYVIAGALTNLDPEYAGKMLAEGEKGLFDAVTYHRYSAFPETLLEEVPRFRETLGRFGIPDLINGESGCQSAPFGAGALAEGAWSEEIQTKITLRRALIDIMTGVRFASVFTSVDIREALPGVDGQGYFGLLKREIKDGAFTGEYVPKPSYFAYRNFISVFEGDIRKTDLRAEYRPSRSPRYFGDDEDGTGFVSQGFLRPDGSRAFAYYRPTNVMTTSFSSTVSFDLAGVRGKAKLLDLRDGSVYSFDGETLEIENDVYRFTHVPVRDYPLVITFGGFAETE